MIDYVRRDFPNLSTRELFTVLTHSRPETYTDCVILQRMWKWFPFYNWHLISGACGEPEGDEWKTLCGECLDGRYTQVTQEAKPLLYCRDCERMRICEELGG